MLTRRTGVPGRARRAVLAVLVVTVAVLVGWRPTPASALALEESSPADGAVLDAPPDEIVLTFDEPIAADDRNVSAACDNDPFVLPEAVLSADARTLTVELEEPMPKATCVVTYTVVPEEGTDALRDSISFSIQESPVTVPGNTAGETAATTTPTTTAPASTEASGESGAADETADGEVALTELSDGPSWLGRLLSSFGLAVLLGSFVLIVAAWPEGPEYVLAVRFLRSVWAVAFVGTLLYVVAVSAAVNDESLGSGLNPARWLDLADAGWPGRALLARLVLVALCGWVVARPERVIDPTTQLPALAVPTLAVATIGLSRTGGDLAALGVIAGIAHVLGMAVWLGAVVLLARVVLAGPGDEDLVHAVRGLGRITGPAIVVTVVAGMVQMYRLVGGALFSSGHGRLLLLKVVAVALMLFIGMTARQVAAHRLARASELSQSSAANLRRAFGTEALIGVVVLALSAALLSFTPAKADVEEAAEWAVSKAVVDPTSGLDVVVRLEPARVGQNRLQVEVRAPEAGVAGLTVSFVAPAGSGEDTIVQTIPLTGVGIADSVTAENGIPLSVAGAWTLQVDATTDLGAVSGAGGSFDVRNADGTLPDSDIAPTPSAAPVTAATTTTLPPATSTPPTT